MALPAELGRIIEVDGDRFVSDYHLVGGKPGFEENRRAITKHTGPDHATGMRRREIRGLQLRSKTGSSEERPL